MKLLGVQNYNLWYYVMGTNFSLHNLKYNLKILGGMKKWQKLQLMVLDALDVMHLK
ncbi:MAG: hypothetical protein PWP07_2306 [Epulopiscium sp.]|jgi:hypothetical protein|nr:hypothetical protein [Defluviitalea raffinosedens]MBZ4668125.1 hypothetical protein [Defluviitaleaceae bacterium]MDK2789061.1 hypothetical protein [Candidatus Epulonipiscium sp.]